MNEKKSKKIVYIIIVVVILLVAIDQITKAFVINKNVDLIPNVLL